MRTLLFSLLVVFLTTGLFSQNHPRLLLDPSDLPGLRDRVTREPYQSMFNELVSYAESDDTTSVEYGQSISAVNTSFLYLLTGDDAWAAKARGHVENRIYDTSSGNGWDRNIKGLRLYWHGRAVALAYDHCFDAPSWNTPADPGDPGGPAFVEVVRDKLKAQADRIYESGGTQQNRNPASNWQNNRFSSAGLIYLAIEDTLTEAEKQNIHGCREKVETYLIENMGDGPDSRGFNIESIGYTMYPWSFTGPFGIAAERNGYGDIRDAAPAAAAYALWTVHVATAKIPHVWGDHYGIHPDFGDDNNNHRGEGCYGLAFYYCPEFLHPGLRHWYDRIVGAQGDRTWDRERHGLPYSLLYYPDDVPPADPMSIPEWRNAFLETGGNGYFTFRDGYVDEDDMIAQLYAKFRGNKGHNGPDALSFRIVGLDSPFAVGGGRYGPDIPAADTGKNQDAYLRSMNTLYPVDPENELSISGNSGSLIGIPQSFPDGGGTVTLEIARNNVGTLHHTRRFLADYSDQSGAEAVYVISDTSEDGNWWQYVQVDLDATTEAITTSGNTFTVTNPNGSSLKATVLYPSDDLQWKTGTRIRGSDYGYKGASYTENEYVHFQSPDGDYLVVMTVCDAGQSHPEVTSLHGTGANDARLLAIGDLRVTVDGDRISHGSSIAEAPELAVTTPLPNETLAPAPKDLEVTGTATEGSSPLDRVEVYYGAVSEYLGTASLDPATGEFGFIIPELPLGYHLFRVRGVDAAGLASYSAYVPVSIHTSQPPRVSFASPDANAILASGTAIEVEFSATDPDGSIVDHALSLNGVGQSPAGSNPWSLSLTDLQPGAYDLLASATDDTGETGAASREFFLSLGQLPQPWVHFDVGEVEVAGAATLADGTLTMEAGGADIWKSADEMHFAFQPFTGDGEIIMKVDSQEATHEWAKAGAMFRGSAAAGAPYAGLFITPGNGVTLQTRSSEAGSSSSDRIEGVAAPVWLRLVREGDQFNGYYRLDPADDWTLVSSSSVSLPATTLGGIAATSHQSGSLMTAAFSGIEVNRAGPPPPLPEVDLSMAEGGGFHINWHAYEGHVYQLEMSTDLEDWTPVRSPVSGANHDVDWTVDAPGASAFFRIVVE